MIKFVELTEADIKLAIANYIETVEKGMMAKDVYLNITPGSNDPREYSSAGVSARVTIEKKQLDAKTQEIINNWGMEH